MALKLFVLCGALTATCVASGSYVASGFSQTLAAEAQTTEPRVIRIAAERFTFTPSRITLEEGTLVEFRISSDDTSHGFHLNGPDNEINVEIPKRGRGDIRVRFLASQVGKYTFDCSQICGAGHDFMRGTIEVKPKRAGSGSGR